MVGTVVHFAFSLLLHFDLPGLRTQASGKILEKVHESLRDFAVAKQPLVSLDLRINIIPIPVHSRHEHSG